MYSNKFKFIISALLYFFVATVKCNEITENSFQYDKHANLIYSLNKPFGDFNINRIKDLKNYLDIFNYIYNAANEINLSSLVSPNISLPCLTQTSFFVQKLLENEDWAIQVFDSFGKPTSGIQQGNYLWVGEYSECLKVKTSEWNGKYCTLTTDKFPILYGMCVPNVCSTGDIASIANYMIGIVSANNITNITAFLSDIVISASNISCKETKKLDPYAIFSIIIISLLVLLVVIATFFDIYKTYFNKRNKSLNESENNLNSMENSNERSTNKAYEPIFLKVLLSFSAYTNSIKLFNLTSNGDQLKCINGIRYMSLGWVVLGHTYSFSFLVLDNTVEFRESFKNISFLLVTNAYFAVETFFLISGVLTCYMFLKEVQKTKKITFGFIAKYYLHRFWRLTPTYAIIIMISGALSKYFGNGPFYPENGFERNMCRNNWWSNLLYINNLMDIPNMCYTVSWYLANDMQFHWVAPLILIPFALGKKIIGFIVCVIFLLISYITSILILHAWPGSEAATFGNNFQDYFTHFYTKPYTRICTFVIGVLVGYYIYAYKTSSIRIRLTKKINIIGWIISLALCATVIFGLYPDAKGLLLTRTERIIYQTFSRTAWAVSVGFIIISCVTGNGGIVNKILSWNVWTPLSRLAYSAFLVHPLVLLYYYNVNEHPIHLQDQVMIGLYGTFMVYSYIAAYFVSMFFEVPLIGLEKFIFKKPQVANSETK